MAPSPLKVLKDVFGYSSFRPLQKEIIDRVIEGRPTLAVLPTGGGKSLCYQIPALLGGGLTVVISPLIALMKDQVDQLRALGVGAVSLNSSMDAASYRSAVTSLTDGSVRLVYLAPESLFTERVQGLLQRLGVERIVVDEAHCISEWGHDFRPEYRRIAELRSSFPQAVCLALTATATSRVRSDIRRNLSLGDDCELVGSFDRPNLFLEVRPKEDTRNRILDFMLERPGQSGIVYCFSRKSCDDLSVWLKGQGIAAAAYHAGLPDEERSRVQDDFVRDRIDVVVATVAFGMGINKSNVRYVIHHDMPKSLENYYQEVGRAGRDGLPAHGLMFFSWADFFRMEAFLSDAAPQGQGMPDPRQTLRRVAEFAEARMCRRKAILGHFGEVMASEACGNCDVCSNPPPALTDLTLESQKFLSCVYRTGERYGAGHVAEVLTGSTGPLVVERGHQELSTWGIGREHDKSWWMDLGRRLEQAGYLVRDEHGVLHLHERARQTLKERLPILLEAPAVRSRKAKAKAGRGAGPARSGRDRASEVPGGGLFDDLRALRKEIATRLDLPPFVVFSDRTLFDMVERRPGTVEDLMEVFGVGKAKAERYGREFLERIRLWEGR